MAGTVAVLFLACQGMAVARASTLAFPQSGAGTAQASCHDAGRDTNTDDSVYQAQCQFQHTSSPAPGANIFAAADLAAITTRIDRIVAVADAAPPVRSPLLQVEPPPLTILHCCLRN